MTSIGDSRPGERIRVLVDQNMKQVVPKFLDNAREDVGTLRAALERQDYEAIARLGHSIKGSTSFGFDYLGEIGLSLERTARRGESEQIAALVLELEQYLDRVEPVYGPV